MAVSSQRGELAGLGPQKSRESYQVFKPRVLGPTQAENCNTNHCQEPRVPLLETYTGTVTLEGATCNCFCLPTATSAAGDQFFEECSATHALCPGKRKDPSAISCHNGAYNVPVYLSNFKTQCIGLEKLCYECLLCESDAMGSNPQDPRKKPCTHVPQCKG